MDWLPPDEAAAATAAPAASTAAAAAVDAVRGMIPGKIYASRAMVMNSWVGVHQQLFSALAD